MLNRRELSGNNLMTTLREFKRGVCGIVISDPIPEQSAPQCWRCSGSFLKLQRISVRGITGECQLL